MVSEHTDTKVFPELIIIDKATLTICKDVQISDYFLGRAFLMKNHWVKGSEHFQGSSQYSKLLSRKLMSIHTPPTGAKTVLFLTP